MARTEKVALTLLVFLLLTGLAAKFYGLKDEPLLKKEAKQFKSIKSSKTPKSETPKPKEKEPAFPAILNLNTASALELEKLPYIGKPTAQKIVDYRSLHGPFKEKSDLLQVDGISIALYKKLEPRLSVQ